MDVLYVRPKANLALMQPKITFNDAWEMIPLEHADDVIAYFDRELQPSHPLCAFKLFPIAKCWRRYRYLVEEEQPSDLLWVLDLDRKKRIRGKKCYYFKSIETQEELDGLLQVELFNPRPTVETAPPGQV